MATPPSPDASSTGRPPVGDRLAGGPGGDDRLSSTTESLVARITKLFVWAVALVLLLRFFNSVAFIALMLLLAGAIASLLSPLARKLPGPRWVRGGLAGGGFLLLLIGAVVGFGFLLRNLVTQQLEQWPQIRDSLNARLAAWSPPLGLEKPMTVEQLRDQAAGWLTSGQGDIWSQVMGSLGAVLVGLLLLAFGSIYFLTEPRDSLTSGVERLLRGRESAVRGVAHELPKKLRWWLIGTLMSVTITATASVIGYSLVGLEFAVALGLFAGFAEFIPTIGPAVALVVSLLIASAQGTTQIAGVVAVYAVVQTLESYVILPLVMKRAVDLPPLVTLFSIVLWGRLLGGLGLVLAIPIDLVIWTVIDHFWLKPREAERGPPAPTHPPEEKPEKPDAATT